ncbi:fungal specific transcription factor domain containing protein [Alternaria alternata]|nr:fungal specific transcription factor domain containing protein [Alternaria alternata]
MLIHWRLKCDRQQPCKTCVDRGLSLSCTYVRSTPTPREPKVPTSVHDRIDQLEKLVTNLIGGNAADLVNPVLSSPAQEQHHDEQTNPELPGTPDRVRISGDTTSYTNGGHWTSILDSVGALQAVNLTSLTPSQISELREHLDQIPTSTIPRDEVLDDVPGPELLFGRCPHATKDELLAALPPRSEADRFVNTFFVSMETHPSKLVTPLISHQLTPLALIHKPTFLKRVRQKTTYIHEMLIRVQYNELWIRPFDAPTMWLGVLYAAFALGFRFQAAMDASQPSSSDLATDSVRMNFYREKAVQCRW